MNHLMYPNRKEVRLQAIFLIVSGILLFFLNNDFLIIAVRLLGIVLTAIGGTLLYTYFVKRLSADAYSLFTGLPSILIGLFMIFSPESLIAMLPILAGIVVIINSIMQLQKAFLLRDYGFANWNIGAGVAVLALIIGIVLLLRPLQSVAFILQIIGCALILEGALLFGFDRTVRKYKKKYEQEDHDLFD